MELEIVEDGEGQIEIFYALPDDLKKRVLASATPVAARGLHFHALFQQFSGGGFQCLVQPVLDKGYRDIKSES